MDGNQANELVMYRLFYIKIIVDYLNDTYIFHFIVESIVLLNVSYVSVAELFRISFVPISLQSQAT